MLARARSDDAELTPQELERIDNLLTAARRFHYTAFVFAGLSLAISSLEGMNGVFLPFGGIKLPSTQAAVGLYLLVIALVMAADRLFLMAQPWLELDPRRLPLAWIALGRGRGNRISVVMWLTIPVLMCVIATAFTLEREDISGLGLSFVAVFIMLLPRTFYEYSSLIRSRMDQRGGRATLSIYLLYWFRLLRQTAICFYFLIPVLAIVPKWRTPMLCIGVIVLIALGVSYGARLIATFRFIYERIDRFGTRFGFPDKSEHYD